MCGPGWVLLFFYASVCVDTFVGGMSASMMLYWSAHRSGVRLLSVMQLQLAAILSSVGAPHLYLCLLRCPLSSLCSRLIVVFLPSLDDA